MNRLTIPTFNKLIHHAVGSHRVFDDMKPDTSNIILIAQVIFTTLIEMVKSSNLNPLAGVDKKDLESAVAEGVLTIEHNPDGEVETVNGIDPTKVLHREVPSEITLSDDIVVQGSRMENGMLYIELERIIPEEKKPKTTHQIK